MSGRILVVDDTETNRRLLQAKLEARYFDVLLAADGFEALDLAAKHKPDIVLLDVMMPGMDGYEVCERLKADASTALIPVVMITALSETEHRIKGLEAGAEDFITKPVQDFHLITRIEALMRYNTVAQELKMRQHGASASGLFDIADQEILDRPTHVLVVDDHPRRASQISMKLNASGFKAKTIFEVDANPDGWTWVDVIYLSLSAANFDPLRFCARFRMNVKTRSIRIIVAATEDERDIATKALGLGASDIVSEPADLLELSARIRTQTRRKRYLDILRRRVDLGMELAVIDPLTGLHNRRYMVGQMEKWLERSRHDGAPFSIIALDIDHFKSVNDTYGHDVGDGVLREFAARVRNCIRPADIPCRQGGEEFVVLTPNTDLDSALGVAERIRRGVMERPFAIHGAEAPISVTVSAGVAQANMTLETTSLELIGRADDALYKAKSAGRNRVETLEAA
ncbi:MAG: PleD family two-component system response regulator [Pseudomonadota bacterium]